jgi:hypothetical protein
MVEHHSHHGEDLYIQAAEVVEPELLEQMEHLVLLEWVVME